LEARKVMKERTEDTGIPILEPREDLAMGNRGVGLGEMICEPIPFSVGIRYVSLLPGDIFDELKN